MFVSKTSSRYLQDMSSRHLQDMPSRSLHDIFSRRLQHMSSRRLQRNNFSSSKMSSRRIWKRSSRRLEDVLEDENLLRWRRVEDVLKTCLEDVLKTSWRPANACWDSTLESTRSMQVSFWNNNGTTQMYGCKCSFEIKSALNRNICQIHLIYAIYGFKCSSKK